MRLTVERCRGFHPLKAGVARKCGIYNRCCAGEVDLERIDGVEACFVPCICRGSGEDFEMNMKVIYEVARYSGPGEDATLLERVQLIAVEGVLRVRDRAGNETVCVGMDIGVQIGSTPALREIRAGQESRITCGADIAAQMPFLLVPVPEGEDFSECFASVNGDSWTAYPTVDSEYVLVPGWDPYEAPSMNPCWAEFRVGEGEWNPLIGDTSIGLVTPGVAVEYARYDHGGMGGSSAVAIRRFDDFTTLFVDWMVNNEVLVQLWGGDTAPPLTAVDLFSAAAAAADRQGGWDSEMDEDESESDEDEEAAERMYYGETSSFICRMRSSVR